MNPLIALWQEFRETGRGYPPPKLLAKHLADSDPLSLFEHPDFEKFVKETAAGETAEKYFKTEYFPFSNLIEFLISQEGVNPVFDPSLHETLAQLRPFLEAVKKFILTSIGDALRARFVAGEIPNNGVCLAFTISLRSVFLIYYDLRDALPVVEVRAQIPSPKGLMEVENIATLDDPLDRNYAKAFLTSGHKIILQGGVLTHVDRRLDQRVFGPTIDTLILADIVLRASKTLSAVRVLEVGSGSGHAMSVIACWIKEVQSCTSLDILPTAALCTYRNLEGNLKHQKRELVRKYGVVGSFDPLLFKYPFDLIVCNPPYVELPPEGILPDEDKFDGSVAGTELMRRLLKHLDQLLSLDGRLLLMASSTSLSAVDEAIPSEFEVVAAESGPKLRVPFDVEMVLSRPAWIKFLRDRNALEFDNHTYWHYLRPLWIQRSKK